MNNMMGVAGLPQGYGGNMMTPIQQRTGPAPANPVPKEKSKHAVQFYGDFGGCGWWRLSQPETLINFAKLGVVTGMHKLIPDERFYQDISSVRLQRQASPQHAQFMKYVRQLADKSGFKMIYEVDDIIFKDDIPDFNKAKPAFNSPEILKASIDMMMMCDKMTVSCDFMKDYYYDKLKHPNIQVFNNMPSKMWFDGYYDNSKIMKRFDMNKKRPRILYAGSGNHFDIDQKGYDDDFSHVKDVIIKTRKDFKWVFLGSIPMYLREYVKSGEMEFHPWTTIPNYPAAIDALNVNAVVAPLLDCTFNCAKSNIKYLESACLGIPGVFQDIITYKEAPLRFTTGDDMVNKLKKLFADRKFYAKISKQSRTYAESMWLDDHLDQYVDLYFN